MVDKEASNINYETELSALHEMVCLYVYILLLADPTNVVLSYKLRVVSTKIDI